MIRITKEFKFEMAHALFGYDGLCKNIHGHSYRLWVTVRGQVKNEKNHAKDGMVMDFNFLKKIVKPEIIDKYDHSFVINANSPHANVDLSSFEKVFLLPYQPTSENLVELFGVSNIASERSFPTFVLFISNALTTWMSETLYPPITSDISPASFELSL